MGEMSEEEIAEKLNEGFVLDTSTGKWIRNPEMEETKPKTKIEKSRIAKLENKFLVLGIWLFIFGFIAFIAGISSAVQNANAFLGAFYGLLAFVGFLSCALGVYLAS